MKKFLWGFVIGAVLAFLAGVNVGRDRPILSNPFSDLTLTEQVRDTAEQLGEDIKESAGDMADKARETVSGPESGEDAPPADSATPQR
jgi:gas vesicle protein